MNKQKEVWSTEEHASVTLHVLSLYFLSSIIEPNQSLVCFFSAWTKCFHRLAVGGAVDAGGAEQVEAARQDCGSTPPLAEHTHRLAH